jgi:hypothetical protein
MASQAVGLTTMSTGDAVRLISAIERDAVLITGLSYSWYSIAHSLDRAAKGNIIWSGRAPLPQSPMRAQTGLGRCRGLCLLTRPPIQRLTALDQVHEESGAGRVRKVPFRVAQFAQDIIDEPRHRIGEFRHEIADRAGGECRSPWRTLRRSPKRVMSAPSAVRPHIAPTKTTKQKGMASHRTVSCAMTFEPRVRRPRIMG